MSLVKLIKTEVRKIPRLLQDLAISAELRRRVAVPHVPGQVTNYLETVYDIRIIYDQFTETELLSGFREDREGLPSQILGTDVKLLVFGDSGIPQPNDVIAVCTTQYRVMSNVKHIKAGSEIVLSIVQGRPI